MNTRTYVGERHDAMRAMTAPEGVESVQVDLRWRTAAHRARGMEAPTGERFLSRVGRALSMTGVIGGAQWVAVTCIDGSPWAPLVTLGMLALLVCCVVLGILTLIIARALSRRSRE